MRLLNKLFHDVDSIQTTFNEDTEGVGGEQIVISDTEETTKEE